MAENPVRLTRAGRGAAPQRTQATVFDLVGGREFFFRLVDRFYVGVESDPELRRIYPDDLEPGKTHLAMFLAQYWGGPGDYSAQRGHPRLRMRHVDFRIDQRQRDKWFGHMVEAIDDTLPSAGLDAEVATAVRTAFVDYFDNAATFMINTD